MSFGQLCNSKTLVFNWKPTKVFQPIEYCKIRAKNDDASDVFNKVLIVDDEQFNIEALLNILKYCMNIDTDKYCD